MSGVNYCGCSSYVIDVRGSALALDDGMTELNPPRVLIVEDEQSIRDVLVELFDVDGTRVESAATLAEAKEVLACGSFDLIVTDIRLGGNRDGGLQVMAAAGVLSPDATVIALTAYPDESNRHASIRLGATHFLEKPVALETLAELATRVGVPTAISPMRASTSPSTGR